MRFRQSSPGSHLLLVAWLFIARLAFAAAPDPATGTRGMVVTPHPSATAAGVRVLEAGGNAIDAAITAALAVAVAQPNSTGIGGGAFLLARLADGRAFAIDARETAPAAAHADMYTRPGLAPDAARFGGLAVGTPGLIAGFALALEDHGTISWKQALAPATRLAEEGVPLAPYTRRFMGFMRGTPLPQRFPEVARIHLPPEPIAGGKLRQPELAATLRLLAKRGPRAFYEGALAEKIAAAAQASGGVLTARDLAEYRPLVREPLRGEYRGAQLIAFPPPSSGGVTLIQTLNILAGFDLRAKGAGSSATIHLVSEALKLAFADRALHLGDPAFVADMPVKQLLSSEYAAQLRARIRDERASAVDGSQLAVDDAGTAHLSVIDAAGNAVAITQTVNGPYGAWVVVPGTGVILNNEMDDFVTQPGQANQWGLLGIAEAANRVEPGKRPLSSMAPLIGVENGRVRFVAGSNGGPRIITSTLLALINVVDFEMDAQEAVSAPRFHHQWRPDVLDVEGETPADVIAALRARGHEVKVSDEIVSGVEAIVVDPKTGVMAGGADPRRDSSAMGVP
jgi:gamma-glutamyltranspeptidase/glutathione hydrolase